jgi:hypothetical protein
LFGDVDFTINKLTSGEAYKYDAGDDKHTFGGDYKFTLAGSASSNVFDINDDSDTNLFRTNGEGDVKIGVGALSGDAKLEVLSDNYPLKLTNESDPSGFVRFKVLSNGGLIIYPQGKNVGINGNPSKALHVYTTAGVASRFESATATASIDFKDAATGLNLPEVGSIGDVLNLYSGSKVRFETNTINVSAQKTPSSATDTGVKGDIVHDTDYLYICTATDTWKRVAISTW